LGVEGNDYMFEVIDGLAEGEEIVVSGQFMLDSESRLKEAIAKMLEVRSKGRRRRCRRPGYGRSDLTMERDDDLDMERPDHGFRWLSCAWKSPDEETKP
jgi:hypothetical protein